MRREKDLSSNLTDDKYLLVEDYFRQKKNFAKSITSTTMIELRDKMKVGDSFVDLLYAINNS